MEVSSIAVWEYLGGNTSGLSLNSANKKILVKLGSKNKKDLKNSTQATPIGHCTEHDPMCLGQYNRGVLWPSYFLYFCILIYNMHKLITV